MEQNIRLQVKNEIIKSLACSKGAYIDLVKMAHTYKADTATVNGKPSVTKVYCTTCKASFEFKDNVTDAVKAFGSNYEVVYFTAAGEKVNESVDNGYTVYVKTGTGATNTTTNTTTSPKTFDAGIAMYVGMALTSVAGSAVVIGKKKEF